MFAWSSAGRLRPIRMVWLAHNYNEPKYELKKWRFPWASRHARRSLRARPKVDDDRDNRRRFPGKTGEWPPDTKKKRSASWPRSRKAR